MGCDVGNLVFYREFVGWQYCPWRGRCDVMGDAILQAWRCVHTGRKCNATYTILIYRRFSCSPVDLDCKSVFWVRDVCKVGEGWAHKLGITLLI